jgi:hypothetical protein
MVLPVELAITVGRGNVDSKTKEFKSRCRIVMTLVIIIKLATALNVLFFFNKERAQHW